MWLSRKEWQRLVSADARREAIEQQLAVLQNSFDWLRTLYNNAVMDRDAIARHVGLSLPTPQIHGRATPATPAFVTGLQLDPTNLQRRAEAEAEAKLERNVERAAKGVPANVPLRPGQMGDNDQSALEGLEGFTGSIYEDVGDELAAAHGITRDDEGNVVYAGKEG